MSIHSQPRATSRRFLSALALACALGASSPALAQQEEPPSTEVVYPYDTGFAENRSSQPGVILSFPVQVSGARWLRLNLAAAQLSGDPLGTNASIVRFTALFDGDVQEQNAIHLRQWQNHSCYFNGDSVLVEVFAYPGTGTNRVVLQSVTAGLDPMTDSQCGPTDDRVLSYDDRAARMLPIGCTGWIFNDCKSCMLTAGHCSTSSLQTAQFNVPLSNSNGSLNNPPASDQYAVDILSKQSLNGGIGNDWGYFGCFPNPNTGLTPFQKQLARYTLALPPAFNPAEKIRITGYGTDSGTSNQVQQTHSGPWVTLSGTTVQYQTDTTGGNSGSPVIHEPSGNAIGIHTHGGCNTNGTGQNSGTGSNHAGWLAALAAPKGVCLGTPCSGVGTNYCLPGALTSIISGTGSASVAANNLVLHASNIPANQTGIFIYSQSSQQIQFANGYLCVGGGGNSIIRLPGVNSGSSGTFTFPVDYNTVPANGQITPGSTWNFQAWFRSGPGSADLSNGLRISFTP